MIDYLEKGKPINEQYYASQLTQMKEAVKLEADGRCGFALG